MSKSSKHEVISTSNHAFPARQQRPSMSVSFDDEAEPQPNAKAQSPQPRTNQPTANPQPNPPPQSHPTIKKANAETSPDFQSLQLPSQFFFYPFKEISVGNIRGRHQAKFAAAAKNASTRMTVEAVSSLLAEDISAIQLTIADFYFVMYQLRLNSSGMTPLLVRAMCSNPDHVLEVAEKKKPRETLANEVMVSKSSLKESTLNLEEVEEFLASEEAQAFTELGLRLDAPRMSDSIELEENWFGKPEYDEIEFLADLAGSISGLPEHYPDGPIPFSKRIEIVGNMDPTQLSVLRKWQAIVQSYGVEEFVTTKCRECGADIETEVSVSAHSFL